MPVINGTLRSDDLKDTTGDDTLNGQDGNDTLRSSAGVDLLQGGSGDDTYIIENPLAQIVDTGGQDTAEIAVDFYKVPSSIEKVSYRAGVQKLPYWIDALLPDEASGLFFRTLLGGTNFFGVAFPSSLPSAYRGTTVDNGFQAFSTVQKERTLVALQAVAQVVNLRFSTNFTAESGSTISFANNIQTGSSGYAFYPSRTRVGSDVFLSTRSETNATLADGEFGALTLIHEIGHALGLEHPFASPASAAGDPPHLSGVEDSTTWTVLSYTSFKSEYKLQLRELDIAALQYLYGPNPATRAGNDTYRANPDGPNFIWDGGGIDTLDVSLFEGGATVFLQPGYWGYAGAQAAARITAAGQITVNFGTVIENAIGSPGPDRLIGNAEPNRLEGRESADTLTGLGGNDTLIGGEGVDVALFSGRRADYRITAGFSFEGMRALRVTDTTSGRDGADLVLGLDWLQFSDMLVALEPNDNQAQVLRAGQALGLSITSASLRQGAAAAEQGALNPWLQAQATAPLALPAPDLTLRVIKGLGLVSAFGGGTLPLDSAVALQEALEALFTFITAPSGRAQLVLNLAGLLQGLQANPTFGAAARAVEERVGVEFVGVEVVGVLGGGA